MGLPGTAEHEGVHAVDIRMFSLLSFFLTQALKNGWTRWVTHTRIRPRKRYSDSGRDAVY